MSALLEHGRMRRALLLAVAVLLTLQSVPAASQSDAAASPHEASAITAIGQNTADELAACLQERPNLAVALLIDETGSLRSTDPDDERAPVLAGFLSRLEEIDGAAFRDGSRQVFVSIAYFGTGVSERLPWSPIDARQPDPAGGEGATRSIARMVLGETPARNRDRTTEFSDALAWATGRHREVPGFVDPASVCTMTLWFSDGELDPDNRPKDPYERDTVIAETATLCDAGGVLDTHRRSGAALVGILLVEQLTESSAVTRLPRMHAMVEGIDPEQRDCGTEPSRGLFLEGDLDLLSLQFERAVAPGQGGVLQGTYRGDPVDFVVDPGVARVRIVMSAREGFLLTTATGATVEVPAPGAPVRSSGLSRGVTPDVRWASGAVSIDLDVAGATGTWRIQREGRSGPVDVYYFGDLRIELDRDDVRLTSGDPGALSGRVVDGAGEPVGLTVYADRRLTGDVDGAPLTGVTLADDGTFAVTFDVDTEEPRIPARLLLDLTTAGGTALQPVRAEASLPVALPGWFPEVFVAATFDRELVPGRGSATLAVTAIGSDLGPTRVCVRPGVPGDGSEQLAQLVSLTWRGADLSRCIDLEAGARTEDALVATLEATEVRQRAVGLPIVIELTSAAVEGRPSVIVDYEERRSIIVEPAPPNPWIVLVLLALGLLIPLLILDRLNKRAARFRTRNLESADVPVVLEGSTGTWRLARVGGGPLLGIDDFKYLPNATLDGQSEWDARSPQGVETGEHWDARAPRWPLGTVGATVSAPAGARIISNEVPTVTGDGRRAGIGLNPQRSAYLVVPDDQLRAVASGDARSIEARLVTVLSHAGQDMPEVVRDHADDLASGITGGDEVDRLIGAVRADDERASRTTRDEAPAQDAQDAQPDRSGIWPTGATAAASASGTTTSRSSTDIWPAGGDRPATEAGSEGPPPLPPGPGSPPSPRGGGGFVKGWD